jgi:hypothetical protein
MKKVILILLAIVFTFTASASMAAEWTIMVYCDADNNLDQAGVEDLNELEYSGSTDEVNMIFLLDRYGMNDTKLYYVLHDPAGNAGGTDMNIISQDISSDAPWLSSEEDMGNPQTLQDFLMWTIENYPANHYLLSIWDHGSGIFKLGGGVTKGECWDDHGGDPNDYIDLEELRDVLYAGFITNGYEKIDIVGHDVCLLGQIETFYQMKDFVKVGIAAEESEPFDGWEYGPPFYDLKNNPSMSPQMLASKIVQYYCERYGTNSYIIQAAVDLSTLETNLIPRLNTFSDLLTYYMYDYQSTIQSARSNAEYYNYDCGRNPDLYHFAQLINESGNLPDTLRASAQNLMSSYSSVMIHECHGTWSPDAHGMSIWFPDNFLTNYCKDDYMNKVEFAQEHWDEFLAEFDEPHQAYTGPVWHISPTGDDSTGDGSPTKPFQTIQRGIDQADDDDTVLVNPGHYYENINFSGKEILVASYFIFDKDPGIIESTIIDGDSLGNVISFFNGEDSNSVIEGFTIRNGNLSQGAGIFCVLNSSPTIKDNIISDNSSVYGGGIYCDSTSSPHISGNTLTGNSALYGGGIYCEGASPTISGNILTHNTAGYGGGIYCGIDCMSLIVGNVIDRNSATYIGGGIFCDWTASPVITNNVVSNSSDGEGIFSGDEAWPTISYNDVWNNADGDFYGGQPGVGDTTWGINYNHHPCDNFHNIIQDPLFADTLSYTLLCSSACIDAGDPTYPIPAGGGRRIDVGIYEYSYTIGEVNDDGEINVCDVVFMIRCSFLNGPCPCPPGEGDVNCSGGSVEISDIVYLIDYLFKSGPAPGCYDFPEM